MRHVQCRHVSPIADELGYVPARELGSELLVDVTGTDYGGDARMVHGGWPLPRRICRLIARSSALSRRGPTDAGLALGAEQGRFPAVTGVFTVSWCN